MMESRQRREQQRALRNLCTIAHVDHGKTTLSDSLLARAGLLNASKAGSACSLDTTPAEQSRGITINATGISLRYEDVPVEAAGGRPLVVNLIDCPGHLDFSGEVSCSLRLSDGAIVVVDPFDSKDGRLCPQTETVLRQALVERVQPVLFVNKIDKAFLGLQLEGEDAYRLFMQVIGLVNEVIEGAQPEGFDFTVSLDKGNVIFGSALMGWGFTVQRLAEYMASKQQQQPAAASENGGSNGVTLSPVGSPAMTSSATKIARRLAREQHFSSHVYTPLKRLFEAAYGTDSSAPATAELLALVDKLPNVALSKADREATGKEVLKTALRQWLPVANAVLDVVVQHLPSPVDAQAYRAVPLYQGPADDAYARGMQECDPDGPLVVYVSKLVPTESKKLMYAYGRVFSGTVRAGAQVRVLGPEYETDPSDARTAKVTAIKILMADRVQTAEAAPAGSVIGLVGLTAALSKSGTVVDASSADAHAMKFMAFKVSPVVRIGVEAAKSGDARKVQDALRAVAQTDPTCVAIVDEATGQMLLAGAGELHLQVRLEDVRTIAGVDELRTSPPIVQYQETITAATSGVCLAKSTNKHNKFSVVATPLDDALIAALADGHVSLTMDAQQRVNDLQNTYGWDRDHARKIVAIEGSNVLVDLATGIDLSPVLDSLITGFRQVCRSSVLAGEPLAGVRFDVVDAKIHSDSPHRRADQVVPAAKRAFSGAVLSAEPRLREPVFAVTVQVDAAFLRGAFTCLRRRRGNIVSDELSGASTHNIVCHMPVADSFGFTDELRGDTSGRAFSTTSFSHWQLVDQAASDDLVNAIRARKGLPATLPQPSDFLVKA